MLVAHRRFCCCAQVLQAALTRLQAFQPGGEGSAGTQVPGWTQLLAAFATAAEFNAKHATQQGAPSASDTSESAAKSDPAAEAVRRVQLWAQAMRDEQSAWDASATTTGGRLQPCAAASASRAGVPCTECALYRTSVLCRSVVSSKSSVFSRPLKVYTLSQAPSHLCLADRQRCVLEARRTQFTNVPDMRLPLCTADVNGEVEPADRTIPQWTYHVEALAGLPRLARLTQGLQDSLTALSQRVDAGNDVGDVVRFDQSALLSTNAKLQHVACVQGASCTDPRAFILFKVLSVDIVQVCAKQRLVLPAAMSNVSRASCRPCHGAQAVGLAATAPLLELAAAALQRVALQLLPLHRATAKLGFVVTALLAGVVQEGFCAPPEAAEGALPISHLLSACLVRFFKLYTGKGPQLRVHA